MKILLSISLLANTIFMALMSDWNDGIITWEVPCVLIGVLTFVIVITFIMDDWD